MNLKEQIAQSYGRPLTPVTLDYESYFGLSRHKDLDKRSCSLSKLSYSEYIAHPSYKVMLLTIKVGDQPTRALHEHQDILDALAAVDWENALLIGHNLMFDALVTTMLGFPIHHSFCTLGASRAMIPGIPHDLDTVSRALRVGGPYKSDLKHALVNARNKYWEEMSAIEQEAYVAYGINDTELTWRVFLKLFPHMVDMEKQLLSHTVRIHANPVLEIDYAMLEEARREDDEKTQQLLEACGVDRTTLRSDAKFAELLRSRGIKPPVKWSEKKQAETWAFSKDDNEFIELWADPELVPILDAKQAVNSSLVETRCARMKGIADAHGGKMPVSYNYAAAHTLRWGGTNKCLLPEAEVLTPGGWVALADLRESTPIMQYAATGELTWCDAPILHQFQFHGDMVKADSWFHKNVYTPDHRIPYLNKQGAPLKDITAARMLELGTSWQLPLSGTYEGGSLPLKPSQARVLAMVQADAHFTPTGVITLNFRKDRKIERCRILLENANIPFSEQPCKDGYVTFYPAQSACANLTALLTKHGYKEFGPWLLDLKPEARTALLDELRYWDAHARANSFIYFAQSANNANWVATLAHLCGHSASLRWNENHNKGSYGELTANGLYSVNIKPRQTAYCEPAHFSKLPYIGPVYCVTTTTSYFITRYKGSISITGNCNLQNLVRGSKLRQSLHAPKGFVLIASDSSQIEARTLTWLAVFPMKLEKFARNEDLYSQFASKIYGRPVDRKRKAVDPETGKEYKPDFIEGHVGKCAELGFGFGLSWKAFKGRMALGWMGGPRLFFEEAQAKNIVYTWRDDNQPITAYWRTMEQVLAHMCRKHAAPLEIGPLTFGHECVILPNGAELTYPQLRWDSDMGNHVYMNNHGKTKVYGGLFAENCTQAIARMVVAEQLLTIEKELPVIMHTHDELVALVPEHEVDQAVAFMLDIMSTPPDWARDLPVFAEAEFGQSYGDCK